VKYGTALKQSRNSVRFLIVAAPSVWALYAFSIRHWVVAAIADFMSVYLLMDIRNIRKIKRAAKDDPEFLNKKMPGT
jgi:hypothetical protein